MQQLRRTIFIIFWIAAGFFVWPILLYELLRFIVYGQRNYGWPSLSRWLPGWADLFLIYGMFGLVTITLAGAMLVLGMRGRLPGTRKRTRQAQGFPVTPHAI